MNAPLSRYLTRFATESTVVAASPSSTIEPLVTMTVATFDAELEAARVAAREEAEATALAVSAARDLAHEAALAEAVAAARAEWCDGVACETRDTIGRAFAALHEELAEATAKALRPLLAAATRERTLAGLATTMARLLADPAHPAITLRAPADLVAALRARDVPDAIMLVAAETTEAVATCGGTRIETRLADALADILGP